MSPFRTLAAAFLVLAFSAPAVATDPVEKALRDELARSMAELRLEELDRPYFLSYRVDDVTSVSADASLGSLLASDETRRRMLTVELRVGDYDFDNTNFLSFSSFNQSRIVSTFGGVTPLPLEDDYREIRRQVWLATDVAYKQALEDLAKKRAALTNKTRTEELADFHRAETVEVRGAAGPPELDHDAGAELARELSRLFLEMPHISISRVDYDASSVHARYVNSEGTSYSRTVSDVVVAAVAATQAADGMWLEDYVAVYGLCHADLPAKADVAAAIGELGRRLADLRRAELLERYNGPVLFEAEAASELVAQTFVPKLLAQRKPVTGDERMARMSAGESDFKDRLGARVLPRFMSVTDDPTAAEEAGRPLYGGFPVDDEGVVGRGTKLVERGFLKTLLSGRTPVAGLDASSGNRRAGGVAPSNLVFRVDRDGMSSEELRRELMVWVADREAGFGVLVRRIGNPIFQARVDAGSSFARFGADGSAVLSPLIAAYKVYPDGREVLLRNVEVSGLSVQSFREIVAATADSQVFHRPFRALSGNPFVGFSQEIPLVSLAVPALLFEELTLKRPSGEIPRLPAVRHPLLED